MGTRRLAITGTDGTGKTTVIRALQARYATAPHTLRAFRAPQYHDDPDAPFARLSAAIDTLSELGDTTGHLELKATALFLQMTLFGDVERHLETAYRPEWVVSERQCLCDSLVYAQFYKPLMQRNLDPEALRSNLIKAIGTEGLQAIEAWTTLLPRRLGKTEPLSLWHVPRFALDVFSAGPAELLPRLMALYQADLPDHIVVLTANEEALQARMESKKAASSTPAELHEQAHILALFQSGLQRAAHGLKAVKPTLDVTVLDTTEHGPDDTVAAVLGLIGEAQ